MRTLRTSRRTRTNRRTNRRINWPINPRINIGMKLTIGFAAVIVLMVATVAVGLNGLTNVVNTYENEALRIGETARMVEQMEKYVLAQGLAVANYVANENAVYEDEFNTAKGNLEQAATTLRDVMRAEEVHTLLDRIETTQALYAQQVQSAFTGFIRPSDPVFRQVAVSMETSRTRLVEAMAEMVEYQTRRVLEAREEALAADAQARSVMTAVVGIALIVAVALAIAINRAIAGPVRQTAATAARLAQGDLTVDELVVKSNDEVGDMATAFNEMLHTWRDVMEQIRTASTTLLDNGQKLLAVANESTGATAQIATAIHEAAQGMDNQVRQVQQTGAAMTQLRRAIDQIASGAQEQAQRVRQTTVSLEQVTQSIAEVSASAQEVTAASGQGAERAKAGEDAVDQVAKGMDHIRASATRVAGRIDELGEYSRQIGQIVDIIGDIAGQTNLLALNAAIEAARAGEHGRGFGVVAEEVRHLAERSAQSTREIGQLIGNMQAAVAAAVSDMHEGTAQVETGTELTGNARAALEAIMEAIRTTDNLAHTISEATAQMALAGPEMLEAMAEMVGVTEANTAATDEMATSSDRVMQAMDEFARISQETAAGTEQVSASTEEVNAAAADVESSVRMVTENAEKLEQLVQRFRLASGS